MFLSVLISVAVISLFFILVYRCFITFGASPKFFRNFIVADGDYVDSTEHPNEWKIFGLAVGFRSLMVVAAIFCIMIGSNTTLSLQDCLAKLNLWDANHYINLIDKGYVAHQENGKHLFLVFYPCYVWLVRIIKFIIPNTALAGAIFSTVCYAWGCCWVHKLVWERYGKRIANDAVLFLSIFPFSFFFGAVMTEGLFLLTTSASCYYALKHKWVAFGIWGAFAALTRMTGILVIVPAVIEFIKSTKPFAPPIRLSILESAKKLLRFLPLLLFPCIGMIIYWLLNYYVDGNPFAYLMHQEHWFQGPMWVSGVIKYITGYLSMNILESNGWAVWLPELALFITFFLLLILSMHSRKNQSSLLAYGFCYLIANYSLSWLLSGGRYLSCGFVFFIFLAAILEDRPTWRTGVIVVESLFLGIFLYGYVSGAQIM